MSDWIAEVNRIAFQLEEIGVDVPDEDKILVLTQGLPDDYCQFIITLDSTPSAQLNIDDITSRLINEESRHTKVPDTSDTAYHTTTAPRNRTPLERITCFNCGKKGHYQNNCPNPNKSTPANTGRQPTATDSTNATFIEDEEPGVW